MKKALISFMLLCFVVSCGNYHEKKLIQGMIDKEYPSAEWKVASITDTIGYSISAASMSLRYCATRKIWDEYDKYFDICHEQAFNWLIDKGGVERRLLIAHCTSPYGDKMDFEIFNEIKCGKSIRYYFAMDEVTDYLNIIKNSY